MRQCIAEAEKHDGRSSKRSPTRREQPREIARHGSKNQAPSLISTKTKQPPELLDTRRKPTDEKQDRSESGKQRAKTPEPPAPVNASGNPSNSSASRPRRNSLPGRFKQSQFAAESGALYDSKEGSSSSYGSESWFRYLETKTQALLAPLRTGARKRVRVAVLDTGIHMGQINHWDKDWTDIVDGKNPRIKGKKDFLDPDRTNKCMDSDGHGTHCVGVIRKVAPEADVYVARVAKNRREGPDIIAIIKALEHAREVWNVDIISLSLGFDDYIESLEDAIQKAISKQILVLAATNNSGTQRRMSFPARMANVISMHAADHNGSAQGTNPEVENGKNLTILGVDVVSAWIPAAAEENHGNRELDLPSTKPMTGTSVATPMAAGIAALVLEFARQRDPGDETTNQVLARLRDRLKKHNGMDSVFRAMAVATDAGQFLNIVPWNLLCQHADDDDGRRMAAWKLAGVIRTEFGALPKT
ncbi:pfs domain-containing protein [Apiospora rasikravindrae]|uniref:Pfs domain-containing protein n=1 Tax=Apiospora rasikravindrae TaxID=990691 RepID=A0ABR1TEI3_9PEZI